MARAKRKDNTMTATETRHKVVSRDEWLKARVAHLAAEKEFTRKRDELSRQRRELPWVRSGEELCFRGSERTGDAGGSFRRAQPADRLPFHAGAELGRRMQVLLVPGRPLRCNADSPGPSRCHAGGGFAGADAAHSGVSRPHGMAVPLGLGVRQRFPERLRRSLHAGGTRLRSELQLRQDARWRGGSCRA